MAAQGSAQSFRNFLRGPSILLAAAFILPAIFPGLFGWLTGLLAIPILYNLQVSGYGRGGIIIRNSIILAFAAIILINQAVGSLIFSFTFIPLGYSLYKNGIKGKDPVSTGGEAILVLGVSWLIFWFAFGIVKGFNPYSQLKVVLDAGMIQTYEVYRQSTDIPADVLVSFEQLLFGLRNTIPKILPGLLACSVTVTVWINIAVGNFLLGKTDRGKAFWPQYSTWKLPDKLAWLPISSCFLVLLGQGSLKYLGFSLGLLSILIFFFQGFAVLMHLLERWKVPPYFRVLFYIIIGVQSFGFFMLAILGLADVWIDFRKQQKQDQ